jgi:hypothetical protein
MASAHFISKTTTQFLTMFSTNRSGSLRHKILLLISKYSYISFILKALSVANNAGF